MEITLVVPCTMCHDGLVPNPNGPLQLCGVCKGFGVLTPDNVCYCGLSCNYIEGGYATCGDPKCLAELRRKAAWVHPQSFGHGSLGPYH